VEWGEEGYGGKEGVTALFVCLCRGDDQLCKRQSFVMAEYPEAGSLESFLFPHSVNSMLSGN